MPNPQFIFYATLATIVGVITLLVLSFAVVTPTEQAVKFHYTTMTFKTDKTYTEGRFFVGVGYSFKKFPKTRQIVRFGDSIGPAYEGALSVRSSDGLKMNIQLAFQYELSSEPEDLVRLYKDYGEPTLPPVSNEATGDETYTYEYGERVDQTLMPAYSYVYARIFASVVRNVCAQYEALDYFNSRPEIAENIRATMNSTLFTRFYAAVPSVELLAIAHAQDDFKDAIELTQIANQDIQQAQNEQQIQQVQAQQAYDVAVKNSEVLILEANQTQIQTLYSAKKNAERTILTTDESIKGLQATSDGLNMTTSSELLKYLYVTYIQTTQASKMLASLSLPSALMSALTESGVSP